MYADQDWLITQQDEVEVLKAIYDTDIIVKSFAESDGQKQFELDVSIPIHLSEDANTVKVFVLNDRNSIDISVFKRVSDEFNAAIEDISDDYIVTDINYIPPLNLEVMFPKEYPAKVPPTIAIRCSWLAGEQKKELCEELLKTFSTVPVLFEWIEWMKYNAASHLKIADTGITFKETSDLKSYAETVCHDFTEKEKVFRNSEQTCSVCLCNFLGDNFIRFKPCKHHVCKECVTYICTTNVTEGTLKDLKCPQYDCNTEIPPNVIQSVLPPELRERWTNLSFEQGIAKLGNFLYCPRCNRVSEQNWDTLALCPYCYYIFCMLCKDKWHAPDPCETSNMDGGLDSSPLKNKQESEESKKNKRGSLTEAEYREKMSNEIEFAMTVKYCPTCKSPITKISGCDHVTCTVCEIGMCWNCNMTLVDHDTNPDECYRRTKAANHRRLTLMNIGYSRCVEAIKAKEGAVIYCRCGKKNFRLDDLQYNNAKCVACKENICFCCYTNFYDSIYDHYYSDDSYCSLKPEL